MTHPTQAAGAAEPSDYPDMDGDAVPAIGSCWMHSNGDTYQVTGYADMFSQRHQKTPPRIIYRSSKTGRVWSCVLSDWYRAMKPTGASTATAQSAPASAAPSSLSAEVASKPYRVIVFVNRTVGSEMLWSSIESAREYFGAAKEKRSARDFVWQGDWYAVPVYLATPPAPAAAIPAVSVEPVAEVQGGSVAGYKVKWLKHPKEFVGEKLYLAQPQPGTGSVKS